MADRLTELVLGLQRLAENAKLRGDDLRYTQEQETYELDEYLGQLLVMTEKLHTTLLEERRKLRTPRQPLLSQEQAPDKMPRIVKQGPKEAG